MAHSTQVFRGRAEVFNDLDLMVLFMFLRDSPHASGDDAEALLFARWEDGLRHYGCGLIRLELDAMFTDGASTQRFASALSEVRKRLSFFGERIPSGLLNARNITPGVVFADYPVALLADAALRLENLVAA